jgi:hypothetical protein
MAVTHGTPVTFNLALATLTASFTFTHVSGEILLLGGVRLSLTSQGITSVAFGANAMTQVVISDTAAQVSPGFKSFIYRLADPGATTDVIKVIFSASIIATSIAVMDINGSAGGAAMVHASGAQAFTSSASNSVTITISDPTAYIFTVNAGSRQTSTGSWTPKTPLVEISDFGPGTASSLVVGVCEDQASTSGVLSFQNTYTSAAKTAMAASQYLHHLALPPSTYHLQG